MFSIIISRLSKKISSEYEVRYGMYMIIISKSIKLKDNLTIVFNMTLLPIPVGYSHKLVMEKNPRKKVNKCDVCRKKSDDLEIEKCLFWESHII